ncbi:DUF4350 domain-containing protein [Cellulomonas endophytica]|uniref:DUF4350 domain-containing protein n=1 Tax=Cellulomonas endophytica TaxID=2494735 RepID=UPI001F0CC1C4|nr:DUF4350 domain-containing protein [Cellulomonas endophytica]
MPSPAAAPAGVLGVVGDGTDLRARSVRRWRRLRAPLAVVGALVVTGVVLALPQPRTSTVPLAPDNVEDGGGRAVAQVLGDRGVDVRYVRTTADALAVAAPGTTLLVTNDFLLAEDQVRAVAGSGADLVLLAPGFSLPLVTDALAPAFSGSAAPAERAAGCDDPDALAAGTVDAAGGVRATGTGDATVCFTDGGDDGGTWAVAHEDGHRVTVVGDAGLLSNARVDEAGHAALALRTLGRHDTLVWYVPSFDDTGVDPADEGGVGGSTDALLPPFVRLLVPLSVLVVAVAALWRVRRTGRLVTEPLPVVVRAGETVRGRGRLYRRGRAHGRAGAALRAGSASRCATRLGLPRTAAAPVVIDAVARATGREARAVEALLYGPPPRDDATLTRLATDLDDLESEVHRP